MTAPALANTEATVERVLEELTCLAVYDVTQIFEPDDDGLTMKDPLSAVSELPEGAVGMVNLTLVIDGDIHLLSMPVLNDGGVAP